MGTLIETTWREILETGRIVGTEIEVAIFGIRRAGVIRSVELRGQKVLFIVDDRDSSNLEKTFFVNCPQSSPPYIKNPWHIYFVIPAMGFADIYLKGVGGHS